MNYAKSEPIAPGRYEIRAGGLGYEGKWKEEARKACPNGYAVVERFPCGDSCEKGTIKCE